MLEILNSTQLKYKELSKRGHCSLGWKMPQAELKDLHSLFESLQ